MFVTILAKVMLLRACVCVIPSLSVVEMKL